MVKRKTITFMKGGDASEEETTCCRGMCSRRSSCLMLAMFALILSHSVFDDNGTAGDAKNMKIIILLTIIIIIIIIIISSSRLSCFFTSGNYLYMFTEQHYVSLVCMYCSDFRFSPVSFISKKHNIANRPLKREENENVVA